MLFPLEKPDFSVRFSTNFDYNRLGEMSDKQCKQADAEYSRYSGDSSEKERLKKVAQLLHLLCRHAWMWYAEVRNYKEQKQPDPEEREGWTYTDGGWTASLRITERALKHVEEARQTAESLKRLDPELGRWWSDQIIKVKWDLKMKHDLCVMQPRSFVRSQHAWQAKHPK